MITSYPQNKEVIDYAHQKVHEGRYFSCGTYNGALANGASLNLLVQNTSQYSHVKVTFTSSGDALLYIFEGTTFSAAGTGITPVNHNRTSAKTFVGTITHTPTITADGTQLNGPAYLPAGDKHSSGGENIGFGNELVLNTSTNYMFRLNNTSGAATKSHIHIEGYQPNL